MSKEIKNIQKIGEIFDEIRKKLENLNEDTDLNQLEEDLKKLKNDLDGQE